MDVVGMGSAELLSVKYVIKVLQAASGSCAVIDVANNCRSARALAKYSAKKTFVKPVQTYFI